MRNAVLLVAMMAGFGCCAISLIDAQAQRAGLSDNAEAVAVARVAAPAHRMRGWAQSRPASAGVD